MRSDFSTLSCHSASSSNSQLENHPRSRTLYSKPSTMQLSSVILGAFLGSALGAPSPAPPAAAQGVVRVTASACIGPCASLCSLIVDEPGNPIQGIDVGNGTGASLIFHLDGKDVDKPAVDSIALQVLNLLIASSLSITAVMASTLVA